jgi:hypothetical protein
MTSYEVCHRGAGGIADMRSGRSTGVDANGADNYGVCPLRHGDVRRFCVLKSDRSAWRRKRKDRPL